MRRLSIRKRGSGAFEVGPSGHKNAHGKVPTVVVVASDKRKALAAGRLALKVRESNGSPAGYVSAGRMSFRENEGIHTRKASAI